GILCLQSDKHELPARACSQFSEKQAFCGCRTFRQTAGVFRLDVYTHGYEPCCEPQDYAPDQQCDPGSSGHGAPVVITMTDRSPPGAWISMLSRDSLSPENRMDSTSSCTALSSGRSTKTHRRGSPSSVTL